MCLYSDRFRVVITSWFNVWIMGGHQPLQPDVYARMPPQVQELMPGVTGRNRADVYEYLLRRRDSTNPSIDLCCLDLLMHISSPG